jgi:hypothetical protein
MTITDNTRVTFGGVQLPVRAAVQQGLLVKDKDGSYREPNGAEEASKQAQEQHDEPERITLDDDTESELSGIVIGLSEIGIDHMTVAAEFIANSSKGVSTLPSGLYKLAAAKGIPIETVTAHYGNVVRGLVVQAHQVAINDGLDPVQVSYWAHDHQPALNTKAKIMLYSQGSLAGFREINKRYMDAHGIGRGPGPKQNSDGVTILDTKGGVVRAQMPGGKVAELSLANAKRLGWV